VNPPGSVVHIGQDMPGRLLQRGENAAAPDTDCYDDLLSAH
jgi:hypothetical protein